MSAHAADITHRVNAERLAILGWGRAILLQLAHPLVAAGVAEHSAFRAGPHTAAVRLHQTVRAMLALSFGDADAHARTIAGIRAIHRRVHGQLRYAVGPYPAGTPYSANDPELLLWVHATLVESIVRVYDDLVAPLDASDRDAYCARARGVVIALGARDRDVPHTWRDLTAWIDRTRASGVITVGPDARAVAAAVLAPPLSSLAWPLTWMNRTITVGMLPDDVRAEYGLPWTPRHARQFSRAQRWLRAVRRRTPRSLAWWDVARQPAPAEPRLQAPVPGREL